MMIATVFDPGGIQKVDPSGNPLRYPADRELRAQLSAQKAWWPTGASGKFDPGNPEWGMAPMGAEIWLDGRPKWRMELVPLFDADGVTVLDAKPDWVDITAIARNKLREERIRLVQERVNAQRAARPAAAEATETVSAFRDTVADPIANVDGNPLVKAVVPVQVPAAEAEGAVIVRTEPVVAPDDAKAATHVERADVEAAGFRTDDEGVTWAKDEPTPSKPRKAR